MLLPARALLAISLLIQSPFIASGATANTVAGVTDKEILIGAGLPITGKLGYKGNAISSALNAYFSDVNEHGGINGRKLRLVVCDDSYEPEKADACFYSSFKDKVFLAGFFDGTPTIVRYLKQARMTSGTEPMPIFGVLTGTPAAAEFHRNVFICRQSYVAEANQIVNKLLRTGTVNKIGIVYQDDALGAACYQATTQALKKGNLTVWCEAGYSRDKRDIEQALTKVIAAQPQVVILGISSSELESTMQFKAQHHWNIPFFSLSYTDDVVPKIGKSCEGLMVSQVCPLVEEPLPLVAQYKKLLKKYDPGAAPTDVGLETMANAVVLVTGLQKAGRELTRDRFIKAMESVQSLDIGLGSNYLVSYNPAMHIGWPEDSVYIGIVRGGKVTPATNLDINALLHDDLKRPPHELFAQKTGR
jgi:ABC-type branched-subunit amino acid transport system substrate-binding protein